jgi:LacI family transcriptional regulator
MPVRSARTPTTIRDIARALSVSHTTVSRALSGRGSDFISAQTRERIVQTAREMNYQPNRVARKLATGRNDVIALWIAGAHPYFATVLSEAEKVLMQHNLDILHVVSGRGSHASDLNLFADGILALDRPMDVEEYVARGGDGRPPVVSMGCYVCPLVDSVSVDLKTGARAAVSHLLEVGCKRVAMFLPGNLSGLETARPRGYAEVMGEWGRETEYIPCPRDSRAPARAAIREYVRERGCPDGIFCFNDDMAIGGYRGLRDLGVRVPEDVALVGCDGIEDGEYLDAPLSTIAQPYEAFCERAWRLLQRRLENPDAPLESEVLPTTLTVRESSRRQ